MDPRYSNKLELNKTYLEILHTYLFVLLRVKICHISGPALPEALFGDVVVTNPKGDGVLVVGGNGSAGPGGHRTNIYELICTSDGQCKWDQLPQKLQVGRSDHVAMLVPDDSVACKK